MRTKKREGLYYYADLFDASGRRWRVPLRTRNPRVAQQKCDKLRRKQRAVETALLLGHRCRVIGPNEACKQIDVDMGDLMGK